MNASRSREERSAQCRSSRHEQRPQSRRTRLAGRGRARRAAPGRSGGDPRGGAGSVEPERGNKAAISARASIVPERFSRPRRREDRGAQRSTGEYGELLAAKLDGLAVQHEEAPLLRALLEHPTRRVLPTPASPASTNKVGSKCGVAVSGVVELLGAARPAQRSSGWKPGGPLPPAQ